MKPLLLSLRFRLIVWFLCIETVALLVLSVLLYGLLSRNLYAHHDESLLSSQRRLLILFQPFVENDFKTLPEETAYLDSAIEVRAGDGTSILSSEEFRNIAEHVPALSLEKGESGFLSLETSSGEPVRVLVTPLSGGKYSLIEVSRLGDIRHTLGTLKILLATIVPMVLIATSFGGYLIASRALAPVAEITGRAREIQAKNLDHLLDIRTSDIELRNLVSTLNAMMERLNKAFRSMQQFTVDASHELKTPLTIMAGTLEVALNQDRSLPEYKEAMQVVLDEMNRMSRIVNQLFLLSAYDAGKPDLHKEEIDLSDLLQRMFELTQALAEDKEIRTVLQIDARPKISGDPGQVSQVIINLIDNAIKYTPRDGRIEITLNTRDTNAVVSVSDTGIGIPPVEIPYVFERFYQVDKARSGENRGVGLGLSIVKRIVEAHEGQISVQSEEGRGTTFMVSFPMLTEPHS